MADIYAAAGNRFVKQITPGAFSLAFSSWRVSSWRGGHDERRWLSALVDALEDAGEPGRRAAPCDSRTLAALRSQLALPAQLHFASRFSLRN